MARKQTVKPDHLRVRVLGASEFQIGSRRIGMNTEGLFALGLYLSTRAGERIPRDEVLEVFWIEGEEESRRHAMRQMMYRLRQKGLVLDEEGEFLHLDPARVDSDLVNCLKTDWVERATADEVEAALALGPTFSTRLAPPFLEWFDGVRSAIASQHRRAAQVQIIQARREGRWADLDRWALSVLKTDPLNEEATLARAESAAMGGSKVAALEILDTYLSEIGEVAPELGKPAMVLRKRIAEKRADWSQKGPREVALVGRQSEISRLLALVDGASKGKSTSLLVSSASGVGKTRLLDETRAYASLKGLHCVHILCEPVMVDDPYALLRELAARLLDLPGGAAISPFSMTILRTLADSEVAGNSISGAVPSDGDLIKGAVYDALRRVGEEARALIVIDDAQNADAQSTTTLSAVASTFIGSRISLLLGAQPSFVARAQAQGLNYVADHLQLRPLDAKAATELARSTARAHGHTLVPSICDEIAVTSGGVPSFVRELAIARAKRPADRTLPESLTALVSRKIASLDQHSVHVLRLVALLGETASVATVRALAGQDAQSFQDSLERLENEAIICLDEQHTLRVHDSWREATLSHLPRSVLAALALQCAEHLANENSLDSSTSRRRAAYLFKVAGDRARALQFYLSSADSLQRAGLPHDALAVLEAAEGLVTDRVSRARLEVRQAAALATVGRPDEADRIATSIRLGRWLQLDTLWPEHLMAVEVSTECSSRLDRNHHAQIEELLSLTECKHLSAELKQRACLQGVRATVNRQGVSSALAFFEKSQELAAVFGETVASLLTRLIVSSELGSRDEILASFSTLERAGLDHVSVPDRCMLLRFSAHALRVAGEIERALHSGIQAFELATENQLHHQARVASELLVFTFLDQDDCESALHWIQRAANLSDTVRFGTSLTSLTHAKNRLDVQSGRFDLVANRILATNPVVSPTGSLSGRLSEHSLAAYVLANTGRHDLAQAIVREIAPEVEHLRGRYIGDFPAEASCRTLICLGDVSAASALAREHMTNHARLGRPPLGRFFKTLNVESN
jgi:DNA-binding SARP family transcriptional activator